MEQNKKFPELLDIERNSFCIKEEFKKGKISKVLCYKPYERKHLPDSQNFLEVKIDFGSGCSKYSNLEIIEELNRIIQNAFFKNFNSGEYDILNKKVNPMIKEILIGSKCSLDIGTNYYNYLLFDYSKQNGTYLEEKIEYRGFFFLYLIMNRQIFSLNDAVRLYCRLFQKRIGESDMEEILDIYSVPKKERNSKIEEIRTQIGNDSLRIGAPKITVKKMKPELIEEIDNDNFVYAKCQCPVPIQYAIKIPKKPGQIRYKFVCEKCGCDGEVIVSNGLQ